jgi:hypothetical protein
MKHYLNGIEVSPRNILSIGVTNNFEDRPEYLEVDADKLILPRESLEIIQQHLLTYGPFEGIPYNLVMSTGETIEYYVDLQEDCIFRDYEIEVKIKKRGGKDNFFDQADGTTWELMAKKGVQFQPFDIPYIINPPDPIPAMIGLGVSIYVITKDTIAQIEALSNTITNIIDSATPEVGSGATTDPAEIATLVVKALLQIAILALTLVALLKLSQQIFELIFPKVRYFQGHKVKALLKLGCQYLGYQFESSLLDGLSGLTICPVPLVKNKGSFWDFLQNDLNFAYTKGYPTASDTTPTIGSLLTALETTFNARTRVRNGVVRLENRLYWQDIANQAIVPALNLQENRQSEYRYNTEEIWKRYYVHYQTDFSDLNTVDYFDPTDAEYSTEPVLVGNADLVTIKGLNDVSIPFAMAVRKSTLNILEKLAKEFFEFVDEVVSAFGGNSNLAALIENRLGVMLITSQFYSVSKLMYTIGGKQPSNYDSIIKASVIYDNYHSINEIAVNDFKIFSDAPVRMTPQDFISLMNNNYVEIEGVICEVLSVNYKDEESIATITYKQPFNWANGKTNVLTINQ